MLVCALLWDCGLWDCSLLHSEALALTLGTEWEDRWTQIMKCQISLSEKWVSSFKIADRWWLKLWLFIMVFHVGSYFMFCGFLSNHKIQMCLQNMLIQVKWQKIFWNVIFSCGRNQSEGADSGEGGPLPRQCSVVDLNTDTEAESALPSTPFVTLETSLCFSFPNHKMGLAMVTYLIQLL